MAMTLSGDIAYPRRTGIRQGELFGHQQRPSGPPRARTNEWWVAAKRSLPRGVSSCPAKPVMTGRLEVSGSSWNPKSRLTLG
jgi:hypothetical protein